MQNSTGSVLVVNILAVNRPLLPLVSKCIKQCLEVQKTLSLALNVVPKMYLIRRL